MSGLIVVILVCSTLLYNEQNRAYSSKGTLESITGTSLYEVWYGYTTILEDKDKPITLNSINNLYTTISVVEAYSRTVDTAVHAELLSPIAKNMKVITERLQKSYGAQGGFTEADQTSLSMILTKAELLLDLLSEVYYVPEPHEGVKITLDIHKSDEYRQIIELNKELKQFIDSTK